MKCMLFKYYSEGSDDHLCENEPTVYRFQTIPALEICQACYDELDEELKTFYTKIEL